MTPRRHVIPIFVPHLGCPNDCVFCNQRKISGNLLPATADDVHEAVRQAKSIIPKGRAADLAFYGGSFTAIPEGQRLALLEAAWPYVELGFLSGLRLSTRPDAIDETILGQLQSFGVRTIELGAQSMDAEVLRLSGRGHTPENTVRAARLIKAGGFELILQMMTGLPGDSREKSIDTAKKLADLKPDGIRVYPTVIIKDTALYHMWKKGEYSEHSVEEAIGLCAELFLIFEAVHVPIIRMGLNPTDDLSGGDAAAGAYHPAFGELVYARVLLNKALILLSDIAPGSDIVLGVHKSSVSAMVGQKRCNLETLTEQFGLKSVKVKATDSERWAVELL